jgi:hypothetical protein
MKMSGQLHVLATLPRRNNFQNTMNKRLSGGKTRRDDLEKRNISIFLWESNQESLAVQLEG